MQSVAPNSAPKNPNKQLIHRNLRNGAEVDTDDFVPAQGHHACKFLYKATGFQMTEFYKHHYRAEKSDFSYVKCDREASETVQ